MLEKYIEFMETPQKWNKKTMLCGKLIIKQDTLSLIKKIIRRQSLHIRCNFFDLLLSCKYFLYQRTVGLKSKSSQRINVFFLSSKKCDGKMFLKLYFEKKISIANQTFYNRNRFIEASDVCESIISPHSTEQFCVVSIKTTHNVISFATIKS